MVKQRPSNDNSLIVGAEIAMPPEQLVANVAKLLAVGMARNRAPCIIVDRIKADELYGLATFVIAGFVGLSAAGSTQN